MSVKSLRATVHKFLEVEKDDRGWERALNIGLAALILGNIAAVILETVEDLRTQHAFAFAAFEAVSVAIFATEYLLRLWSCTADPRFAGPLGRLRFVLSPMALVDLVAILPSLIPGGSLDLRFARSVRLLRLARSLKFARYSESLRTLGRVVRAKRSELGVTAFLGAVLLVCASCGIYFVEHDAQPKAFSSIPGAMWWSVVTLTTVGYGDVFPVTPPGKALASVIAILGIGLFALPTGILASGFNEELQARRSSAAPARCPHCGGDLSHG
jgi:voltage-gated potassium channel